MKNFTRSALIVTALVISVGAYAHLHTNANSNDGYANPGYQNTAPMSHDYQQMQQWVSQMRAFCFGGQHSMMGDGEHGVQMGYGMGRGRMGSHMQNYQYGNANEQYSRMGANMMDHGRGMGWYQQNNTTNHATQQSN
ncbi:MAG: hypothetical protein CENE_00997 [Candidatus Celerinatantimonas neptuna]|nr:MAG: hypothetical protein CENE_00997 [Candidatus Celerinatantimonas neptuna]